MLKRTAVRVSALALIIGGTVVLATEPATATSETGGGDAIIQPNDYRGDGLGIEAMPSSPDEDRAPAW